MACEQDRFLRNKLSEDSSHLVKENALLNQQVIELTKQSDRVRVPGLRFRRGFPSLKVFFFFFLEKRSMKIWKICNLRVVKCENLHILTDFCNAFEFVTATFAGRYIEFSGCECRLRINTIRCFHLS